MPSHHCSAHEQSLQNLLPKWLLSTAFSILAIGAHWLGWLPEISRKTLWEWAGISCITGLVILYSGGHYLTGAWAALQARKANMNTLIAMGVTTAWAYSTILSCWPHAFPAHATHTYYDSALFVISFVTLGAMLEAKASHNTNQALSGLLSLQVQYANVEHNRITTKKPIDSITIGEILRIKPGEHIPLDGIVTSDRASVDESMVTGEAMPQTKLTGDHVTGGTLLINGSLLMQATHTVKDSMLARIAQRVQDAQNSQLPIGKLVDQIAAHFAPTVLILSILTALIWLNFSPTHAVSYAVLTSISMLLIACPCALGLATPISIALAIGKAAQCGILVRHAQALQNAANLQVIMIDKTGTLTHGKSSVNQVISVDSVEDSYVVQLAASVETFSEHPLANCLVTYATKQKITSLPMTDFKAVFGHGIEAKLEEQTIRVGSQQYLEAHHIDTQDFYNSNQEDIEQGDTGIWVACDQHLVGFIGVYDAPKSDSTTAIAALQALNISCVLLSGDQEIPASHIAKQVGIDQVIAQVSPEQKADHVKQMQQLGKKVGMVGDGINDAPALAQADSGFAIGSGSDIAIESGGIVVLNDSLMSIADLIRLARSMQSNIKQNLFFAFCYNVLALPIAAGILYPINGWLLTPTIAGAAMALSSLSVVLNANRLLLFTKTQITA